MEVTLLTYGATILSVKTPSKTSSVPEEVTLCSTTMDDLLQKTNYYGCTAGRVANRIAKGKFTVDNKEYSLVTNNGVNHLHGGTIGYDKVVWTPRVFCQANEVGVEFTYVSPDGEEGYPGNVVAKAEYKLTASNEIAMTFTATTDKSTPINMCNHAYWNLSGNLKNNIYNHILTLNCPGYLPVDSTLIPTGVIAPVANTDMDFTTPTAVGKRIKNIDGGGEPGYDHCYSRSLTTGASAKYDVGVIATLEDPESGRKMIVSTNAPGVQLYTGNFIGKGPTPHDQHRALCLETENYPDAINQYTTNGFPNPIVKPGEVYHHVAIHKFEW